MPKAVSAPGFRQTTSGAHGNADRTDRLPRGKPPVYTDVRRFCRKQSPAGGMTCRLRRGVGFVVPWALSSEGEPKGCMGRAESPLQAALHDNSAGSSFLSGSMTRRLRRGWWDLQSQGAFILFFRWRKKSMQKKASGTATPGKRLLLPILTAGLAMSRAMELDSLHTGAERARARLFSADKMGGPFSLRCLSPRCPGAVGGEHTQPLQGGVLWRSLYFFARQKASGKSNPRWPFQRAMRPVAEWRSLLCSWRESAPDPRAARPVAERR